MYTDPGMLAMLIAAIVGMILAIPTYIIIFRQKIGWWLIGKDTKKKLDNMVNMVDNSKKELKKIGENIHEPTRRERSKKGSRFIQGSG